MGAAREVLKIQSPNLNDDAAKAGILDTLRRGVEVRLVLTKKFNDRNESLPGQGGSNEATVDELYATAKQELGSVAACRLLRVRWHALDDGTLVEDAPDRPGGLAHVKYLSVDDQVVIIGSGNMDTQSWNFSGEVNVAVDDAVVTRAWDGRVFDPHFEHGVATGHCP
jgi:phosphatidylserine/phosphatidylglycerophosphate/cardiolipin synthase-like enzyme